METKDACAIMYSKVTHAQFTQVLNQSKIGAHLVSAAALRRLKQFRQELASIIDIPVFLPPTHTSTKVDPVVEIV